MKLYNSFRLINKSHRNDWLKLLPFCSVRADSNLFFWSVSQWRSKKKKNVWKWNVIQTIKKCHHNNSAISSIFLEIISRNVWCHILRGRRRQPKKRARTRSGMHLCQHRKYSIKNVVQNDRIDFCITIMGATMVVAEIDLSITDYISGTLNSTWQQRFRFCFLALIFCDVQKKPTSFW